MTPRQIVLTFNSQVHDALSAVHFVLKGAGVVSTVRRDELVAARAVSSTKPQHTLHNVRVAAWDDVWKNRVTINYREKEVFTYNIYRTRV